MAPTTVTTIVLALFGLGLLAMACWAWFGDWQPEPRRAAVPVTADDDIEAAVLQMRRAIEDYERRR